MKTKIIWIFDSYEGNLKATLGGDYKLRLSLMLLKKLKIDGYAGTLRSYRISL